jgi:plastocyanin
MRPTCVSAYAAAALVAAGLAAAPLPSQAADLLAPVPVTEERVVTVAMTEDLLFAPETVTVQVGDTVVWQNRSNVGHTVTADEVPPGVALFDSGTVEPGAEFRQTFTAPGTYHYYCVPHRGQGMIGTVIVEP